MLQWSPHCPGTTKMQNFIHEESTWHKIIDHNPSMKSSLCLSHDPHQTQNCPTRPDLHYYSVATSFLTISATSPKLEKKNWGREILTEMATHTCFAASSTVVGLGTSTLSRSSSKSTPLTPGKFYLHSHNASLNVGISKLNWYSLWELLLKTYITWSNVAWMIMPGAGFLRPQVAPRNPLTLACPPSVGRITW